MGIPLNIDIQQIFLHLLNFSILAFGLYMLLYKPVKSFMDKRTETIQKMNDEAKEKLDKATANELSSKAKLSEVSKKASEESERILKEAKDKADLKLKKANDDALKIVSDAKAKAQKEKEEIVHDAHKEIAVLAATTADKLIREALKDE